MSHGSQFTVQLFSQMFTQVLGIMTSLVIMSHSKERPFVLLHIQAIFQSVNSVFTSSPCCKHGVLTEQKKYLREDLILPELLSDNLSNIPDDIFSESDDSVREINIVRPVQSESESSTSSKESDNTSNARATTWVKEDKMPNLGHFTSNPGVKHKMEAVERESGADSARPGPSTQTPCRPHGDPPWESFG
jgi:hypothetical protein